MVGDDSQCMSGRFGPCTYDAVHIRVYPRDGFFLGVKGVRMQELVEDGFMGLFIYRVA